MALWDLLFLSLVILPIATGGIWLQSGHVHVEYTEPGVVAMVLVLWLGFYGDAEESRIVRTGFKLWTSWTDGLTLRPNSTLRNAWIFVSALWFTTSLLRHRALGSGLADLGIFTNAIFNVNTQGFPFSSLKNGASLLSDHQDFLIYPLGWIFPVWPSPVFLLLLQSLILPLGGIALYLLGRQRLGSEHPAVPWLPFLFWMAGPIRAAARFDFHPEIVMLPLFLFAAFYLQEFSFGRRLLGLLLFMLALAAKESAGPVACGLGLAWLLGAGPEDTKDFTRPMGAVAIILGGIAFMFDSSIVPSLFGVTYAYSDLYAPLPASATGMLLAPFKQHRVFFGRLFSGSRLRFLFGTLLPEAFLPLVAPLALVASLPGVLMLFLTNGEHRISLGYHYAIEPMVGLLFALPVALDTEIAKRYQDALLPLLAVAALISYGRSETYYWRNYWPTAHQAWVRDEILPFVPEERSVVASYAFVPHLATRRWVNQPLSFKDEKDNLVDCVLLDPSVNNTGMSDEQMADATKQAFIFGYVDEYRCGSFTLFRRPTIGSCMNRPLPPCPGPT